MGDMVYELIFLFLLVEYIKMFSSSACVVMSSIPSRSLFLICYAKDILIICMLYYFQYCNGIIVVCQLFVNLLTSVWAQLYLNLLSF